MYANGHHDHRHCRPEVWAEHPKYMWIIYKYKKRAHTWRIIFARNFLNVLLCAVIWLIWITYEHVHVDDLYNTRTTWIYLFILLAVCISMIISASVAMHLTREMFVFLSEWDGKERKKASFFFVIFVALNDVHRKFFLLTNKWERNEIGYHIRNNVISCWLLRIQTSTLK